MQPAHASRDPAVGQGASGLASKRVPVRGRAPLRRAAWSADVRPVRASVDITPASPKTVATMNLNSFHRTIECKVQPCSAVCRAKPVAGWLVEQHHSNTDWEDIAAIRELITACMIRHLHNAYRRGRPPSAWCRPGLHIVVTQHHGRRLHLFKTSGSQPVTLYSQIVAGCCFTT